jgi:hypothetical protein
MQLFYVEGLLPKSVSARFGVVALLRSAEFVRKMKAPRFAEARLQRQTPFGQHALET